MRYEVTGWATTVEGKRVQLSTAEARSVLAAGKRKQRALKREMPDALTALQKLGDAHHRLGELGWRGGSYCPKDGRSFAVIEFGSTGIFGATYTGNWPDGHVEFCDCISRPQGLLWKALDKLTDEERAHMEMCDAAAKQYLERSLASKATEWARPHD